MSTPTAGHAPADRLSPVSGAMAAHVGSGSVPGVVWLVDHDGDIEVGCHGVLHLGDPTPMRRDTIFRIASLTKPIAAAALLTLVDDGVLRLHDPVARWLPELAEPRVLRRHDGPLDDTVPAARPITVEDLLTYRMGSGTLFGPSSDWPVRVAEDALDLRTFGPPWPPTPHDNDAWLARFATLPLLAQPGEHWHYNTAGQVLGVLVERAGGAPLEQALRERLFDPLGMRDTGFHVPADRLHRLPTYYTRRPSGLAVRDPAGPTSWWATPPAMPSAASWLVSTIDDYAAFARMLADDGVAPDGGRVLSAELVAAMTRDHLTEAQHAETRPIAGRGQGWGYGLAVALDGDGRFPHGYGWDGGSGTTWRTDRRSGVIGIVFTQHELVTPESKAVFVDFWRALAASLPGVRA
jgi:CubicO group peptidase (beta-lactamase class C family)